MAWLLQYLTVLFVLLDHANGQQVITMDPGDKFKVSWITDEHFITFTIIAETTGWVGLGQSPQGAMTGADITVAWVNKDGEAFVQDFHGVNNGLPRLDASQDVQLVQAEERDGITTVVFKRKFNTCDNIEDKKISTSTTRLIYAYGTNDPDKDVLEYSVYHGSDKRGVKSVYLLDEPRLPASDVEEDDLKTFDFQTMVQLSDEDTTYYCSFHKMPKLAQKHHVVKAEMKIVPGNEDIVHHVLVFACYGHDVPQNRNCFSSMPNEANCGAVVFGWAVGGTDYHFPKHTGFAVGDATAPDYYLMQSHYDNPSRASGRVDNSTLRISYTSKLRDNDAGVLSTGSVAGLMIPPKAAKFDIGGFCFGDCTRNWIPEGGIKIFSYFLHSHLLGTAMKVHWYRNGQELEPLAYDEHYDFNYQEFRTFRGFEKTLMPGDTLRVTCSMDSTSRNAVTYGGEATSQEMCLAFLTYYPRQNASHCQSVPQWNLDPNNVMWKNLGYNPSDMPLQSTPQSQEFSKMKNIKQRWRVPTQDLLANVTWTESMIRAAQTGYEESPQMSRCLATMTTPIDEDNKKIHSKPDAIPYKSPEDGACVRSRLNGQSSITPSTFLMVAIILLQLSVASFK